MATATIQNAILRGLPVNEYKIVISKTELVSLPVETVLNEANQPISFCYFVESGLVSIQSVMSDGERVEVGQSGKEGFIGLPLAVGLHISPTQALMQIRGRALR